MCRVYEKPSIEITLLLPASLVERMRILANKKGVSINDWMYEAFKSQATIEEQGHMMDIVEKRWRELTKRYGDPNKIF